MSLVGKKFWTYRIDSVLGTGGTATVYQAVDERDGKTVAVKILPEGMDRSQIQRFKQEVKVLSQLDHPNIIKIFDIGSADGLHFYVMANTPSKTLRELMEERFAKPDPRTAPGARAPRGFTAEEILGVGRDVADALRCSHSRRIYHRDVKPSNILITPDFRAILCDFGLAKLSDDKTLTQAGTLMGTPLYMSPEQLQGGDVDHRSDVYQLGLVLYQMATGTVPFAGDNPYVSATRRLSESIPAPSLVRPGLPGGLDQIIVRCTERERIRRYQTSGQLIEEIDALTERRLKPGTADATLIRETARRRWLSWAAASLLATLAGAAVWQLAVGPAPSELRVSDFAVIPGRREATVAFMTDRPLASEAIFGEEESLDRRAILSAEPSTSHRVSLRGLSPGKRHKLLLRLFPGHDRVKELPVQEFSTLPGK
ncbi:MAG: serine/threonine protein kinase [Candidatus Wallbacteria bacterium]|nr:serine/threonine protein kinase [Candidatus Wallbacteria bacterium]